MESVDVSLLSYDELKDLQTRISSEIVTRDEWKETKIPSGEWVVGVDVPAGEYRVTIPQGGAAHMKITNPAEIKTRQEVIDWFAFDDTNALGKIILEDGFVVMISVGEIVLSNVLPLGF